MDNFDALRAALAAASALLAVYLSSAFAAWELDPSAWHPLGRIYCVYFGLCAAFFAVKSVERAAMKGKP